MGSGAQSLETSKDPGRSWEYLGSRNKGSDDKSLECLYANTHIPVNKKKKFAVSMCSLRITLLVSLEVQIFDGTTHVTQVLKCTVAGCSRETKKSKRGGLVLHRKDQPDLLEISCRQEDRSVNLEDWRSWFQRKKWARLSRNSLQLLESLSNLDVCMLPLWHARNFSHCGMLHHVNYAGLFPRVTSSTG